MNPYPSEDSRDFFFLFLWVAKKLYFQVRNACQHPGPIPRTSDANMTSREVRLQTMPLQNLSQETLSLKKEMKCSEKKSPANKLLHELLESENKMPTVRNLIFCLLLAAEQQPQTGSLLSMVTSGIS